MKDEYDFSNAVKNPYAKRLEKQRTTNPDTSAMNYSEGQEENK